MLGILLVLFIVVPIAELAVIIQIGQWLGVLPTIALLVFDSIVGAVLVRMQGRAAWRRFSEAIRAGRPPAREVLDGALVLGGGALLLTPGFLTDLLGLSLLLPPTRAVVRSVLARRLVHRMTVSLAAAAQGRAGARSRPATPGADIDGTAVDVDAPRTGGS